MINNAYQQESLSYSKTNLAVAPKKEFLSLKIITEKTKNTHKLNQIKIDTGDLSLRNIAGNTLDTNRTHPGQNTWQDLVRSDKIKQDLVRSKFV